MKAIATICFRVTPAPRMNGPAWSALKNCGGFPDVFANSELNHVGLIESFERAMKVRQRLVELHPEEPHANGEVYALWRLEEAGPSALG